MEREQIAYLIVAVLVLSAFGAVFYAWYNKRDRLIARQRGREKKARDAARPVS